MARLHVLETDPRTAALWRLGRAVALVGLAALVATLLLAPQPALHTLWSVAVPLLPASFFVAPALWRGICPLSTLNAWGNHLGAPRELTARESGALGWAGLAVFQLLVPARHLALNTDGPALAATLVAIGLLALLLGARYASRSAFCNALCPVLPVERLYGQAPLLAVERGRCTACSVCTPRGCIDLAEDKAARQVLGNARQGDRWLLTPFGLFAAALPGFILGYASVPDAGWTQAGPTYAATIGGSLASVAGTALLVRLTRATPARAVTLLAAVSGTIYYWVTAPMVARTFALGPTFVASVRTAALLLVGAWIVRIARRASPRPN